MEEIKVKIKDRRQVEKKIEEMADFEKEVSVRDIYFREQRENALKISKRDEGSFIRKYEKKESGFELVKDKELENPDEKKKKLEKRFGIKADQKKKQRFYNLNGKTVLLNHIENLGDFLIVQAEKVSEDFIEDRIGFEDPEYIEVPFSNLK